MFNIELQVVFLYVNWTPRFKKIAVIFEFITDRFIDKTVIATDQVNYPPFLLGQRIGYRNIILQRKLSHTPNYFIV